MRKIYIWRDALDKFSFSVGVKSQSGDYVCWASLPIEGVKAFFGDGVAFDCDNLLLNKRCAIAINVSVK